MFCESYRTVLSEAAARGERLPGAVETHLAACAACRAAFAEEQALFSLIDGGLRSVANAEVPASLLPRVRAGIPERPAAAVSRVPVWAFAAASLLLITGVAYKLVLTLLLPVPTQSTATATPADASPLSASSVPSPQIESVLPPLPAPKVGTAPTRERATPLEPEVLISGEEETNLRRYLNLLQARNVNHAAPQAIPGGAEIQPLEIAQIELPRLTIEPLESGDSR